MPTKPIPIAISRGIVTKLQAERGRVDKDRGKMAKNCPKGSPGLDTKKHVSLPPPSLPLSGWHQHRSTE